MRNIFQILYCFSTIWICTNRWLTMAEVVQIYNSEILYIVLYTGCSNKIKPSDEFLIR